MKTSDFIEQAIAESAQWDTRLSCFITRCPAEARRAARTAKKGKLSGRIISVKDNICTRGIRTTAGSAMLANYVPTFNATVIDRIEAEGGIVIGKTAMDSFGFGTFSTNVGEGFPIPKNPRDLERSAGGSSGGAGAITAAASFPHLALAESTGGSITAPAAFCGVVGFTPSYGKVSRYGLIDYANSLDKIGTMGKTVAEAALLAHGIMGKDPKDESSTLYEDLPTQPVKTAAVLVPMREGCDSGIVQLFDRAIARLRDNGIQIDEVAFPWMEHSVAAYYILSTAEASSNLARYTGLRYGAQEEIRGSFTEHFAHIRSKYFGPEEKRRIILGTFVRTAGYKEKYYLKARALRQKIHREFSSLFKRYDALLAPSMPILAPRFDEIAKLSPVEIYALDRCTIPPNLAGLPHLSIPMGVVRDLPAGLQIVANQWQENSLLAFGRQVEKAIA